MGQVLSHLHNWFQVGIYPGAYAVVDKGMAVPFLQEGQYFRIVGSLFNDGLHQYGPEMDLQDEVFEGAVWALAVPPAVVALSKDIAAWEEKYGAVVESPYTSESFGGYSYSKASGAGDSAGAGGWKGAFRARLNLYRKLREI